MLPHWVRLAYPQARKSADGASFTLEPHTSITLTLPEGDNSFGLVCKIWPAHDDLLLVSVPLIDSAQSSDGQHVGDIELLVLDGKSLQVRQRLLQPGLMNDDAIAIRKIAFDTGRYRLAPDVTAFGASKWQTIRSPIPSAKPTFGSMPSTTMPCAWCSTASSWPAMAAKATPIAPDPFIPARPTCR